jgi:hypothetical protein
MEGFKVLPASRRRVCEAVMTKGVRREKVAEFIVHARRRHPYERQEQGAGSQCHEDYE